MKAKTVKEVLIAARWILNKLQWIQNNGIEYDADKVPIACCAWGAIQLVNCECSLSDNAVEAVLEEANDISLSLWNDRRGRTKSEVLKAFDRAIRECK